MPTVATRVFVSHSHADNEFTERLVSDLSRHGAQVWVDREDIPEGSLMERINEGLSNAEWLVLVQTPAALRSNFVRAEVNAALTRVMTGLMQGVLPIIAAPCAPQEIPPLWQTLLYYDATQDYAAALAQLVHALGLDVVPQPSSPLSSASQWSPVELMWLWSSITPGARRAVAEIALRPEGYAYEELFQRLGYDGPTLGGYLSSWGSGLRQFRGKPDPLIRDWNAYQYRMDAELAGIIRRLAAITAGS